MNIEKLINEKIINFNMNATSKKEAITQIARLLYKDGRLNSLDDFILDINKREEVESTNMEIGIAIPHSNTNAIKKSSVAIARLNEKVDWEDDSELVKIIILLAVAKEDKGIEHLEVISKIAELLLDDEFVELLNKEEDATKLINKMQELIGGE